MAQQVLAPAPATTADATIGAAIITRDDLPKLKELLDQLTKLDQVVVVDTGSRDGTREYLRKLGPPFELHTFAWRPRPASFAPDEWGFAAARNESFRHLRTTHAVWLDSDDLVTVLHEGRREVASAEVTAEVLRRLAQEHPEIDLFLVDYIYMTDEFGNPTSTIGKERMLRLDFGWKWRFPVHEMVVPAARPYSDVRAISVQDVFTLHRPHATEISTRRNIPMLRAWLRQLEKQAAPEDNVLARARFLVGRSYAGEGQYMKAAQFLLGNVLAKHPNMSPEDKWEGWMDVAKNLYNADDVEGARQAALQAIGICPRLGEGYAVLAEIKARTGERPGDILKLLETADSCARESYGVHEHNPMTTGFNALVLGAECQLRLNRYREALTLAERALELRPTDARARQAWEQAVSKSREQLPPDVATSIEPVVVPVAEAAPHLGKHTPIFVVSSGRCGSTLVSNMLNLNRDILSLSELVILLMPGAFIGGPNPIYGEQFWALLSTPRKRMNLMYRFGVTFDELLYKPGPGRRFTAETGIPPLMMTALPHLTDDPETLHDEMREFVLAQGPYPIGQHYRRLFDWMCEHLGRKLWVERSGSSMVHLTELLSYFPDARYIHLFRDGRECAISMSKHNAFRLATLTGQIAYHAGVDPWNSDEPMRGEVPDELKKFLPESFDRQAFLDQKFAVEGFGGSWSAQERRGIELLAQVPSERVLLLRYESLVANPKGELTRVMRFIGAPYDDDYLERAASIVRVKPPSWPQLPPDERERLDRACRTGMGLLYGTPEVFEEVPAAAQ